MVATIDGQPAGFALFYATYRTVLGLTPHHFADLFMRHVPTPSFTLQALPYDVGGHPGMAGVFVILQFGIRNAGPGDHRVAH